MLASFLGKLSSCGAKMATESSKSPYSFQLETSANKELVFLDVFCKKFWFECVVQLRSKTMTWMEVLGHVIDSPTVIEGEVSKIKKRALFPEERKKKKCCSGRNNTCPLHVKIHICTKSLTSSPILQLDLINEKIKAR